MSAKKRINREVIDPITGDRLLTIPYEPVRWIVQDLIPEGVTLFAGKPKAGKTWIALHVAVSVASGGKVFNIFQVETGEVLLLPLDDRNPRRMQDRLKKLVTDGEDISRIHIPFEWTGIDGAMIDGWLADHPTARLVIVDTLAAFRREMPGSTYEQDYAALHPLQEIASARRVGILVIHHLVKSKTQNPIDAVRGSGGLTAAVDTIATLARNRRGESSTLSITGRDVRDLELELEFDDGRFILAEDDGNLSPEQLIVYGAIEEACHPIGPREISETTGLSHDSCRQLVRKLLHAGKIENPRYGLYTIAVSEHVEADGEHTTHTDCDYCGQCRPTDQGEDESPNGRVISLRPCLSRPDEEDGQ